MLVALLIPLVLASILFLTVLVRSTIQRRAVPRVEAIILGAVASFFDTLGIGCFAPTIAWFKFRGMVADKLMPATMLVGYTLASLTEAIIFLILLGVFLDPALLVGCVLAVLMGALTGAPLVAKSRVWVVQAVVGLALLLAAFFYALTNLGLLPKGGAAASLPVPLMITAIVANFIFGVLLNFGVGNYAPSLAMFSLMGMDPRLSFPIMAGGAALAGAGASVRHISIGQIDLRVAAGLAIGCIPAVLVAAFIVRSMSVELLRWLVFIVVVYAAVVILRSAATSRRSGVPEPADELRV